MIRLFCCLAALLCVAMAIQFPLGKQLSYQLSNDVFVHDFGGGKPIAYRLTGVVRVASILGDADTKLLKFILESPELHVRPHGSFSQTEFKPHRSPLDNYRNKPFYGSWQQGNISQIYVDADEETVLVNLKKAIVSLFQRKTSEGIFVEEDAAGVCNVEYRDTSPTDFRKMKRNCVLPSTKSVLIERFEQPMRIAVQNHRSTEVSFLPDGNVDTIESRDYFYIATEANRKIGSSVDSFVVLRTDETLSDATIVDGQTEKDYLLTLKNYKAETLSGEPTPPIEETPEKSLKQLIKQNIDNLSADQLGTSNAANAFIELLPLVRVAKKAELVQILKANTLQQIKAQMLDLLGAAQSVDTHEAVKEAIDLKSSNDVNNIERYLQALAISTRPNEHVIADLLKLVKSKSINAKVKLTLIHALGSMAYRFAHGPKQSYDSDIVVKVETYLTNSLLACDDSTCYETYLNGLRNLQSYDSITKLIAFVEHPERGVAVAAVKALKAFPPTIFNRQHIGTFETIFYQLDRRYDASTRTLVVDILLKTKLNVEQVKRLLNYLKSNDKSFEVKKYAWEMIKMVAEENERIGKIVYDLIQGDSTLNNYHILQQRGLSIALSRKYSIQSPFNGTLTSTQEMFGGVLKRGVVDLSVDTPTSQYTIFSLGLYAGGLSSFVSSNTDAVDEDAEKDDETAYAGMEITVQQSYFRPLEFFRGQGELMGHVWSGTASEPTPAYTATAVVHDHQETIQLNNGATIWIDVLSAQSIDLNGAVQMSLWNRNAECQVNQLTGLAVTGQILVNAGFVSLDTKFNVTTAPKLHLNAKIDFSTENILCMQLSQPADTLHQKVEKNQIIPEVRHRVKTINNLKSQINGFTHFFNQKNNDMCNQLMSL